LERGADWGRKRTEEEEAKDGREIEKKRGLRSRDASEEMQD